MCACRYSKVWQYPSCDLIGIHPVNSQNVIFLPLLDQQIDSQPHGQNHAACQFGQLCTIAVIMTLWLSVYNLKVFYSNGWIALHFTHIRYPQQSSVIVFIILSAIKQIKYHPLATLLIKMPYWAVIYPSSSICILKGKYMAKSSLLFEIFLAVWTCCFSKLSLHCIFQL